MTSDSDNSIANERRPAEGQSERSFDSINSSPDVHETLERMEEHLRMIYVAIDADTRERRHRHFSFVRLSGVIVQIVAAGFLTLALFDWILEGVVNALIVKLAFAVVFQLAALTAFVVSRHEM